MVEMPQTLFFYIYVQYFDRDQWNWIFKFFSKLPIFSQHFLLRTKIAILLNGHVKYEQT
jgi:hypothetical protein